MAELTVAAEIPEAGILAAETAELLAVAAIVDLEMVELTVVAEILVAEILAAEILAAEILAEMAEPIAAVVTAA
jgi:hypothetical protein